MKNIVNTFHCQLAVPVLEAAVLVEEMASPVVEHHLLLVEEGVHLHQIQ